MSAAYYNEIDPFAAAWLEELVRAGHIAPGEVDTRSIEDVEPSDLAGFAQCHFFAGIGVWSYALRRAGWPDDRPVWTGSCPCQPFSAAGKRGGFADERHLWPAFFRLISQRRPVAVFGEQVASRDGLAWLDLVSSDLEGAGYACGAVDTCATGFGAPHIRQRLYWVAHSLRSGRAAWRTVPGNGQVAVRGSSRRLDDSGGAGLERFTGYGDGKARRREPDGSAAASGRAGGLAHAAGEQTHKEQQKPAEAERKRSANMPRGCGMAGGTMPVDGFWGNADWLLCRDGRWRPVEPGSCPLAHGTTARVGRLRGYGNAIVAPQAEAFIRATMEFFSSRYVFTEGA